MRLLLFFLFINLFLVSAEPFAGSNVAASFTSSKNKPNNFHNNSDNNDFQNFAIGDLT